MIIVWRKLGMAGVSLALVSPWSPGRFAAGGTIHAGAAQLRGVGKTADAPILNIAAAAGLPGAGKENPVPALSGSMRSPLTGQGRTLASPGLAISSDGALVGLGRSSQAPVLLAATASALIGVSKSGNRPAVQWNMALSFPGVGNATASPALLIGAREASRAFGVIGPLARLVQGSRAVLIGRGAESPRPGVTYAAPSAFPGIGRMIALSSLAGSVEAQLGAQGVGKLTSAPAVLLTAKGALLGAGRLIPKDSLSLLGKTLLIGAGKVRPGTSVLFSGRCPMRGDGAVNFGGRMNYGAAFACPGTAKFAPAPSSVLLSASSFPGTSGFGAKQSLFIDARGVFSGSGNLIGAPAMSHGATWNEPGTGEFSLNPRTDHLPSAVIEALGRIVPKSTLIVPSAIFVGPPRLMALIDASPRQLKPIDANARKLELIDPLLEP